MIFKLNVCENQDRMCIHTGRDNAKLIVSIPSTLREESSQTNVILQYKLLAAILSSVCSVIQQS